MSYSILVVDGNAHVRHSIRSRIEQSSDFHICGEAENGEVAVEKVEELRPDVVILDFQMPVMNGLDAARQIRLLAPNTVMLMFTIHDSEELLKAARAAGIKDVLSKLDGGMDHLLAFLRNLAGST